MIFKKICSKVAQIVLMNLLNIVYFILDATYRFHFVDTYDHQKSKTCKDGLGYLVACWHETVLTVSMSLKNQRICAMCSNSMTGQGVAFVMKRRGFIPVMGSQSERGKQVREEIHQYLTSGTSVAVTIDGSSGPRRVVKPGIVDMARKSGAPIIPIITISDNAWVLNTWDKFRVPKPFANVWVLHGEPIYVPASTEGREFENFQILIRDRLDELMIKGERMIEAQKLVPSQNRRNL